MLALAEPLTGGPDALARLIGVLALTLAATELLGLLAAKAGQPRVLGELLAGVLLGASLFGLLDPTTPLLRGIAELGVVILLFQIGLHTDVRSLARVGGSALTVGVVGVLLPFALGYASARWLGLGNLPAVVCAAALTATSIGISARVLADLGELENVEGRVVLGAAVLDDVVGLVILSVVAALAAGGTVSPSGVVRTASIAVGFVVAALLLGKLVAPPLFNLIARAEAEGTLGVAGLAFALALASLAAWAGSATIMGAFAAGLVLHGAPQRHRVERAATSLGHFFVPIFFASVGAAVDLRTLADPRVLAIGVALLLAGVVGKMAAGFAPWWLPARKLLIGLAMVPRGEVGLIFAQTGYQAGVLDTRLFSAVTLVVMATTLLVPPVLARVSARTRPPAASDLACEGGIDDLVAGAREMPGAP